MAQKGMTKPHPTLDLDALETTVTDMQSGKYKRKTVRYAESDQSTVLTHDQIVRKFIVLIMKGGNKDTARRIMDKTMEEIKRRQVREFHRATESQKLQIITDPRKIFNQAVNNLKPVLLVTSVKRGGIAYQVPVPCPEKRQLFEAMKIIKAALAEKTNSRIPFHEKLATIIMDAAEFKGKAMDRKIEILKNCERNRAYAHFK
ncbi:28S ribosomal protein S7, mitochondrial isoform X2 [Lingula anatina]|nr:28S ribosomal protein S7, mitochondrial isoform X2 [Lingula anatina]|eukprot:XP_013408597.1 28S ribosomal protein S7, mitochondrial isoform X2 [Lingula anatina]